MTTYSTISNAALAVGGIPSSTTVTALRDNPIAIAESASGAPILAAGWHPYDKVDVGDGATGLFYDFAIHGGQTEVLTPAFADGWEYKIVMRDLSHASGTARALKIDLQLSVSLAYIGFAACTTGIANVSTVSADLEIYSPRVSEKERFGLFLNSFLENPTAWATNGSAWKASQAKIYFVNTPALDAGKMYLLRRRCYRSA